MRQPNRNNRVVAVVVLMAALFACRHPAQGTDYVPPPPFANVRLVSSDLWSGGDVTVISSSFQSLGTLPALEVAGIARTKRRINDSTMAAQLPDSDAIMAVKVVADSFETFDTRTLAKNATLRAPAAAGPSVAPGTWDKYRVVPYVRGAVLFVVATSSSVGTIPTNGAILRFGLPRQ